MKHRIVKLISSVLACCMLWTLGACGSTSPESAGKEGASTSLTGTGSEPAGTGETTIPAPSSGTPTASAPTLGETETQTASTPTPGETETQTASTPTPGTTETPTEPDGKLAPIAGVFPAPLSAEISEEASESAPGRLLTPSDGAYDAAFARFGFETGEGGLPVRILTDESLEEEEYRLSVKKDAVTLTASGARGVYLAISTLAGLRSGDRIAAAEISDKPAAPLRGVIEGFYGDAWTHEFRLDLFEFMGKYKLNTYIYAPKDDPKHRQNWRSLYSGRELERMKELVSCATENGVRFVYAISPGLSINLGTGYESDFEKLCRKCQSMYDLGVRDFAIFLDDIDSRDAEGHAKLLNDFETQFVKTHDDCSDLIAISPEYEKIWLTAYTDRLAKLLHPDILMMWTGNETLPASIKKSDLTAINRKYGRKVFIWWNFPCNDFARDSLFMGPCVNLGGDLCDSISGLVSNPMNQGYASMLPLLTISEYLWNPAAYDPEGSARAACSQLAPDCAEGLYDLMDLTRASVINGCKSSLQLEELISAYRKGGEDAAPALSLELERIARALAALSEKADPKLLAEIGPWLEKARAYIGAARAVVSFDRAESPAERGNAAMQYASEYKKTFGNPSSVSRDVLEPFVFEAKARFDLLSGRSVMTDLPTYQSYLPDNAIDGDPATFFWSNGAPSEGSCFTVDLGSVCELSGVRLTMGSDGHKDDYIHKGVLEYSTDGTTFTELCALGARTVEYEGEFSARLVRLRCTASQTNWVIISEFAVTGVDDQPAKRVSTNLPTYQNYAPGLAIDGDPSTFFWSASAPSAGGCFTVDLGRVCEISGVRLTMGSDAHRDDYIRKGVLEYSTDGETYVTLCALNGRELSVDDAFTARFVRLRCTASQSNWVIIREFTVQRPADLPDGVSFDGTAAPDFSPLFDRDLFTAFKPNAQSVEGKKLYIDLSGAGSVELYLAALAGVRVYLVGADGEKGDDLPLAFYMSPDLTGASRLCLEFTAEQASIAEIVIG